MKKWVVLVVLSLISSLAFAENSLSFAPPATDFSVVFLGNLFGIVDGVLHGSGSQIMGAMFSVFNSAVLAIGGVIIIYTLIVSTMNTAHEGQMLGQKWSSIWIPVRSTIGLALLIPKASGYCLMQIFVMWIVIQGIGAADKIWDAALSYLNRGGVIIRAQAGPGVTANTASSPGAGVQLGTSLLNNDPIARTGVSFGAYHILSGQVCMLGLQKQLENLRQKYLKQKSTSKTGPCYVQPMTENMGKFCTTAIPDFLSSVNAVTVQNEAMNRKSDIINPSDTYSVSMPNFPKGSAFDFLNGICGTIQWNAVSGLPVPKDNKPLTPITTGNATQNSATVAQQELNISPSQIKLAQMSRAIAIQQMYSNFTTVAQVMVNNNPIFATNTNTNNSAEKNYSLIAKEQFGVPYTAGGTICKVYSDQCVIWGPASSASNVRAVLFNGTEFQGAITDYNTVMAPTLNLINMAADVANANKEREFITKASNQGWIMAGAYFFDLVRLNGNAVKNAGMTDNTVSFDGSSSGFSGNGAQAICPDFPHLCEWLDRDKGVVFDQVTALLNGTFATGTPEKPIPGDGARTPGFSKDDIRDSKVDASITSSSVNGFVNNSLMIQIPGQPGIAPLQFANMMHFSVDPQTFLLKEEKFDCGEVKILFFSVCIGRMFGNLFYNIILRYIYNVFATLFSQIIHQTIMAFLMIPLQAMAEIFKDGLKVLSQPGVNPVIALANMGVMYINFSSNLWLTLINLAITASLIPLFGVFIFALLSLALPLILAWVSIMVSIGFITAYYVPILPYMIFTFGALAWIMSVIEAMVAAPIVALGVTHPEGHDAFGKAEAAIMILMNVFLRPALMIIGYISAIALCYVGVWLMNAGFDHAIGYIQSSPEPVDDCQTSAWGMCSSTWTDGKYGSLQTDNINANNSLNTTGSGNGSGNPDSKAISDWAGIYAYFFSILIYTTMYLTIVQKSFTLISVLPDKVLRWIGGTPESIGQETTQWGEEAKSKIGEAGKGSQDAQGQIGAKLGARTKKMLGGISKPAGGGKGKMSGTNTPDASSSKPPEE